MTLTFTRPCRQCGGDGWYRESDPAGNVPASRCLLCNPLPPKPPMSPDRLRAILAALRWSLRGLAGHLGHASDTRVVQWAMDRKPVPAEVAEWLERVAAWHLANQAPRKP